MFRFKRFIKCYFKLYGKMKKIKGFVLINNLV